MKVTEVIQMKKVFISQPMKDKTDAEIKDERARIENHLKDIYGEVEILDSFFEGAPHDVKPLWFLGKSLEILSKADVAIFADKWHQYRGCRIEHLCAVEYGIETLEMPGSEEAVDYSDDYDGLYKRFMDKED